MSGKSELIKILSEYLKEEESVRIACIIDYEGFPISVVFRSREDKIKPKTLGSLIKQSNYLLEFHAKSHNLQNSSLQIQIFESGCLCLINLGSCLLGLTFKHNGWPLSINRIYKLLLDLRSFLVSSRKKDSKILAEVIEKSPSILERVVISEDELSKTIGIFNSLGQGQLGVEDIIMKGKNIDLQKKLTFIGHQFNSFIMNNKGVIFYKNQNYPEYHSNGIKLIQIQTSGMDLFKMGKCLCSASYLNDVCFMNSIICESEGTPVYMFQKIKVENNGFQTMITPFNSVINYLMNDYPSQDAVKFINILIFVSESIDELKKHINYFIENEKTANACIYMERTAILAQRQKKYDVAAEIYKSIASLHLKKNKLDEGIKNYKKSARISEEGRNYQDAGMTYLSLAKIYQKKSEIGLVLQNYSLAEQFFQKAGNNEYINNVKKLKTDLFNLYSKRLSEFIKASKSEVFSLDFFKRKFNFDDNLTVFFLKELIHRGIIPGEVDLKQNRYTKSIIKKKSIEKTINNMGNKTIIQQAKSTVVNSSESKPSKNTNVIQKNSIEASSKISVRPQDKISNIYIVDDEMKYFDLKQLNDDAYLVAIYSKYPTDMYKEQLTDFSKLISKHTNKLKQSPGKINKIVDEFFDNPKNLNLRRKMRLNSKEPKICPICGTKNLPSARYCSKDKIKLIF